MITLHLLIFTKVIFLFCCKNLIIPFDNITQLKKSVKTKPNFAFKQG